MRLIFQSKAEYQIFVLANDQNKVIFKVIFFRLNCNLLVNLKNSLLLGGSSPDSESLKSKQNSSQ